MGKALLSDVWGDVPLLNKLTFSRGLPKKFDGSVDLFCKFARGGFFIAYHGNL